MLYDPKWEKTKPDPHSMQSLIAWLELQPPHTSYNWECTDGGCLIGLYSDAVGCNFFACHSAFFNRDDDLSVAAQKPHTFGAALERARAIVTSR